MTFSLSVLVSLLWGHIGATPVYMGVASGVFWGNLVLLGLNLHDLQTEYAL